MATVAFFNLPAHGHINPTLPLVSELVRRGEHVVYYSLPAFRAAIEATGAVFRDYGAALPAAIMDVDPNLFRFAGVLLRVTGAVVRSVWPTLRADPPAYIIHDSLCPWGKYLAHLLGVPAVCSTTTFVLGLRQGLTTPEQIPDILRQAWAARREWGGFLRLSRRLARSYHVRPPLGLDVFTNRQPLTLVYTARRFQPWGWSFGSGTAFVGPSYTGRSEADDFPWAALDGRPLIYISLGTVFSNQVAFFRQCFAAFADAPYQVVLSLGGRADPAALGPIPANCIVRPFVPQLALLQRAALFITHGGMNSVSEALYYGVPLVVVPQAADQLIVARRVARLGAGVLLSQAHLTPAGLRADAARVLADPRYPAAARRVGDLLCATGGAPRAADVVWAYTRAQGVR